MHRYDRQLRIVGEHGQARVARSVVLCLGSGTTAGEFSKNIVLFGVGELVIVDDAVVSEEDLRTNFLCPIIGTRRAEQLKDNLIMMNPSVKIRAINEDPMSFCSENDLSEYDVILSFDRPPTSIQAPLLVCSVSGLLGIVALEYTDHEVWDRADMPVDLRIDKPWQELVERSLRLDDLGTVEDVGHVPWIELLVYVKEKLVSEGVEITERRILERLRVLQKNGNGSESNFKEAYTKIKSSLGPPKIPSQCMEALSLSAKDPCTPFRIVAKAVHKFVEMTGRLPLVGRVPDLTSDTASFVKLKNLYKTFGEGDCAAVAAEVSNILCLEKDPDMSRVLTPEFVSFLSKRISGCAIVSSSLPKMSSENVFNLYDLSKVDERIPESLGGGVMISTASVIGAMGAQEAIKILTHQFVPVQGAVLWNGYTGAFSTVT